jgi:23S rRNA pseudouridine1911/1915/1917 synthase
MIPEEFSTTTYIRTMLQLLYKNNQLIAFSKPVGLAVQPDESGETSLLKQAEAYCQHPLHVVHRIDQPVSGVVLFAKSPQAARAIGAQLQARAIGKTYLAVVSAAPPAPEGTLVHYIHKNPVKNRATAFDDERPGTERAELNYRTIGASERYWLLEVQLITGRHHQVRAQLAAIGCPIKGDVKYGARRSNADRSIHLHAWKMEFKHPVSEEQVIIEAPLPEGDAIWDFFKSILV